MLIVRNKVLASESESELGPPASTAKQLETLFLKNERSQLIVVSNSSHFNQSSDEVDLLSQDFIVAIYCQCGSTTVSSIFLLRGELVVSNSLCAPLRIFTIHFKGLTRSCIATVKKKKDQMIIKYARGSCQVSRQRCTSMYDREFEGIELAALYSMRCSTWKFQGVDDKGTLPNPRRRSTQIS